MRPSCAFALFASVWVGWRRGLVAAAQVNVTIDDSDPSILYRPSLSWHNSSNHCSTCLKPNSNIAYNGTWHDGTHIIPTTDNDDDSTGKESGPDNPFEIGKWDPGFVDKPVTAQLKFTGSAVYLYCIQPLHVARATSTPTYMNLSFTLDGHVADVYIHSGSKSAHGFSPHINVFTRRGLAETPHLLQVNVGPDSVFLFDYMQYTQTVQDISITAVTAMTVTALATLLVPTAQPETETVERHNTGTFAGAVGGSVGVLTVFALGLALNLYRRRLIAARRDCRQRQQDELLHGNTGDGQPMHGPAPFVPRYFPGTLPTAPPPYVPSASHSQTSSSGTVPLPQHPSPISYADLPPSTPPPPTDDGLTSVPAAPPPFGAAITMPALAVLPVESQSPSIPVAATPIPPLPPDIRSEHAQQ